MEDGRWKMKDEDKAKYEAIGSIFMLFHILARLGFINVRHYNVIDFMRRRGLTNQSP